MANTKTTAFKNIEKEGEQFMIRTVLKKANLKF